MNVLGHYVFLLSTLPVCTDFMLPEKTMDYDLASFMGLLKGGSESDDHKNSSFPLCRVRLSHGRYRKWLW